MGVQRQMKYRRLSAELVSCMESDLGGLTWPSYRPFKTYSIRNGFGFAEREYLKLRRFHIAIAELVESLITYLGTKHENEMVTALPALQRMPQAEWIDYLSAFIDGQQKRRLDYYRGVTWRELPLLLMMGNGSDEDRSYCRNEASARCIADAQYIEIAKSLTTSSEWRQLGVHHPSVLKRLGDTPDEFSQMVVRFWSAIPESVWLVHSRHRLVGGSVIIPLVASAYEKLRAGDVRDQDLDPLRDLHIPGRDLFVVAMTELPDRPRPRLPGVKTALQMRKFVQHGAVLLGSNEQSAEPVRLLAGIGSKSDEISIARLGWKPLGRCIPGSETPLYEIVLPAPEITMSDYSSAAASIATLIGACWRMFRTV